MDFREFLGGGISGMAGVVAGQPLDTIRVRIQKLAAEDRSHGKSSGGGSHASRGGSAAVAPMSSILMSMVNREGILSPFKGMLFPLLTATLQNAVVFQAKAWGDDAFDYYAGLVRKPAVYSSQAAQEPLPARPLSSPASESSTVLEPQLLSNKAPASSVELPSPFETPLAPSTLQQPSSCDRPPSGIHPDKPTFTAEPPPDPAANTVTAGVGLQFLRNFTTGCVAGGLQTLISSPVELVKIQRQLQCEPLAAQKPESSTTTGGARSNSPFTIVRRIVKYEGIKGLFRGFEATFIRDAPSFGLYFAMYPPLRDGLLVLGRGHIPESACSFLAGGFVGAFTWALIYPLDSIKTRLQSVSRQAFMGIIEAYNAEKNKAALWKGLTPTLMRGFVVNAAIFVTYEASMKLMGGRGLV